MTSRFLVMTLVVTAVSCGTHETARRDAQNEPRQVDSQNPQRTAVPVGTAVVPQNPGDRTIRQALNLAIDRDADLKNREISFLVSNGDVSVTGVVRSEEERGRINDLALGIPGVKSVANALRVAQQ